MVPRSVVIFACMELVIDACCARRSLESIESLTKKPPMREAFLERETRFELATPTLARLCSTTELFPQKLINKQRIKWRPVGESNPCYRRERAVS